MPKTPKPLDPRKVAKYLKPDKQAQKALRTGVKRGGLKSLRVKGDPFRKISPIKVERLPKVKRSAQRKKARALRGKTFAPVNILADIVEKPVPFDPAQYVQDYIDGVMNGSIVVGRFVKMCVERHVDDLKHGHERGLVFSPEKAIETILFFATCLRFTKGEMATKPFLRMSDILEGKFKYGECSNFVPSPNQAFILWCIYGWRWKATGYRRFTTAYITAGRKWGKSEFGAGVAIKHGIADDPPEPGARVIIAATKKEQAFDLTWKQARQMVESSPALRSVIDTYQYALVTENKGPQPFSSIKAIGSNSKTSDGFDASCIVLDELHAWEAKKHGDFYDKLVTATGSRRQPLMLMITTAGNEQSTIWNSKDAFYCRVLESALEGTHVADHVFAFIARLDEERPCKCGTPKALADCPLCKGKGTIPMDDLYDETNWPKANPNFPHTPTLKALREDAANAKLDPHQANAWKQYHCNMKSSSLSQFISSNVWLSCGDIGIDEDWSKAEVVAGGVDIGTRDDLASMAVVGKFRITRDVQKLLIERLLQILSGVKDKDIHAQAMHDKLCRGQAAPMYRYRCKSWSWTGNNVLLRNLDREPWAGWKQTGQLKVSQNIAVDLEEFQDAIISTGKLYKVKAFRADPNNAAQLLQNLEKAGFEAVEHRQSYQMYNEPLQEFLRVVQLGIFNYDIPTSTLLTWAIGNSVVRKNNFRNEIMLDKEKSPDKIDPAVATVMAFAEAYYTPPRNNSMAYSSAPGSRIFS